jgi:hypothetical protein
MDQTNKQLLRYLKPEIVGDTGNYARQMICKFVEAFIESPKIMRANEENGDSERITCESIIHYIGTLLTLMPFIKENSHGTLLIDKNAYRASGQDDAYCYSDCSDYLQPKLLNYDDGLNVERLIAVLVDFMINSSHFMATANEENQDKRQAVEKILAYVKKLIQNLDDVDITDNGTLIIDGSWRYREPPKPIHQMSIQEKYDYVEQEYGIPDLRLIGED